MNKLAQIANRFSSAFILGAVAFAWPAGCSVKVSHFEIVDHRSDGGERKYHETFPDACYTIWPDGNTDIVLSRTQPSQADPSRNIRQIIHLRTIWRSIPGTTVAEKSQINARVSYMIVMDNTGATFEGAGSVFFKEDKKKHVIQGSLELALLRPTRRLPGGGAFFEHAEIQGVFKAVRDRRRLVRTINNMDRLFGPVPGFQKNIPASMP
ncbi:MAG: hypothetical protein ACE5E5_15485 [Phycisphaerae bacterium]